ncbi:MAG: hypothetical protein U9Q66_01355 [Patescibacteria group bacterium]|nr:hypothetical protein [Patescibacteria group bacterium]
MFILDDSLVDHIANSSIFTLPNEDIHSLLRFSITVALYGGINSLSISDEHVVGIHFSQNISFTAIGAHANLPSVEDNQFLLI